MSDAMQRIYDQACHHARQTALWSSTVELLGWDERTMMPAAGAEFRADQMTLLSGLVHQRRTDRQYGAWLEELAASPLAADPHSDAGATIRQLVRDYRREVKLPQKLVEELTRTAVLAQQAWVTARQKSDFASFRPWLEKTFHLKRQEADALGFPEHRYDALLDSHEPEMRTSQAAVILRGLRDALVPLLDRILGSGRQADIAVLQRNFPAPAQEAFGREVAARIGFDFQRGRLDVTTHPFCAGLGPHDCRITTRYNPHFFNEAFFGIAHEAGHGIYDQGLRSEHYGLPLGSAVSLGLHESQSRMWENFVARSLPFWRFFYPDAQKRFPEALADVSLERFHFAVNDVRPSLIRVEADEATYNLHILIRFELEQSALEGDLPVADLPGAWNEKYEKYLAVRPPNDATGVLQDIHWSAGLVGYFPTYAFGNLYAAQLFAQADRDLGGLAAQFSRGEFGPLREWLRSKVHHEGQRWPAGELVARITGKPLSHAPLVEHLTGKLGPLYGLT